MEEQLIIKHCSPTLAGIKTGNLFSCSFESHDEMKLSICELNQIFVKKGLRALPLRYRNSRALIYVFRPEFLRRDLRDDTACSILHKEGYRCASAEHCVVQLVNRLKEHESFPHEIGLFLGYPPEDVLGFIENNASGYKCAGCWKVYGDEAAARCTFEKYKKCAEIYYRQWEKGKSIKELTMVA
ncbi:DUF3793 family protein [Eubacteriales bacterium OttesenSCG-928-N13]|nr:DUF3793 family protein [Eubacteriales bacterium OttesenSCG-928-N13]